MFKKSLQQGQAGDNAGLLLRGVKRDDVVRGQLVAKPGSIKPHTRFEAEVGSGRCLALQELRSAVHAWRGTDAQTLSWVGAHLASQSGAGATAGPGWLLQFVAPTVEDGS